jgi:hypothetical protein
MDMRSLNRLLGRGGRIADTPDPHRYAAVFRRLVRQFGDRLRYGFMFPVNLLLEGVVHHPIYHEPRIPQLATLALFREEDELWRVRAVLAVRRSPCAAEEREMFEKLAALYSDFGVELLVLKAQMIDNGYLKSDEFMHQVTRAILARDSATSQPPPSPLLYTPTCIAAAV